MVEIDSRKEFEEWLQDKPVEWAQPLAARSAMRVLPLTVGVLDLEKLEKDRQQALIIAAFRATLISWAARKYPAHDMRVAADSADSAAAAADSADSASAAAYAAAYASAAAADAYDSAAADSAAAAAAYASAAADSADSAAAAADVWHAIKQDIAALQAGEDKAPSAARGLVSKWLWIDESGKRNTPEWYTNWNRQLIDRLNELNDNWQVWTDWHNAGYRNSSHWGLKAKQSKQLVLRIVDQDDKWWERGPSAVNREIAGWIEELRKIESTVQSSVDPEETDPDVKAENDDTSTSSGTPELPWLSDGVDPDVDHLGRSGMGFALAVRVNEIWDTLNKTEEEPPNFPSRDWWKSKIKRFDPRPIWRGERLARLEPGFVVHLDAPWGGGKTSFAKFLTTILNPAAIESEIPAWLDRLNLETNMPQDYQRQWHIVQFNAWRHQHISPPWWVFYETIRRQCSASLYAGDGSTGGKWWATFVAKINVGRLWLLEYLWRLWSPGTRIGIGISLVIGFVVYYLASRGLIGFDLAKLKLTAGGSKSAGGNGGVFWTTLIMLFMGAAAPLVTIFKAFTSTLLPGTPAAAKNYSLGSGDPLERFRRHFARMMERYKRPILVVVDDLDRCSPEFVVDLVRGMQTILVSPRVVFLLLGDRDWVEKSFAEVHKSMQGIDVGPEHEFGARFVEKAIQLSFVLPDISAEERETYVRRLLTPAAGEVLPEEEKDEAVKAELNKINMALEQALSTSEFNERKAAVVKVTKMAKQSESLPKNMFDQFVDDTADELFLKEASDKSLLLEAASRIEGLSAILPANPRQIKRIINTLSLLMVIAERKYGGASRAGGRDGWEDNDWQILARWVLLLVEWPKTWFTLCKHPELADHILNDEETVTPSGNPVRGSLSDEDRKNLAAKIQANKQVMEILTFNNPANGWNAGDITTGKINGWLKILTPPTSGEMLDGVDGEK